jgi:hypothetical protein
MQSKAIAILSTGWLASTLYGGTPDYVSQQDIGYKAGDVIKGRDNGTLTSEDYFQWLDIANGTTKWSSLGLPAFATGSSYVPNDMTANIHQGEMIWDRQFSDGMRKYGIPTNGAADNRGSDSAIVTLLTEQNRLLKTQLGIQQATYQETSKSSNSLRDVANTTKLQAAR